MELKIISKKISSGLKKFWFLLWKDESLNGWIFSIIFLFIFIKLIFFPVLGFLTGTSLPLAIVESCSMYHQGNLLSNYDEWWKIHELKYEEFKIEKFDFEKFRFKKGFNKGDILFVVGVKPEKLKMGDVIIFNGGQRNPIIHRIIKIENECQMLTRNIPVYSNDTQPGEITRFEAYKECEKEKNKMLFPFLPNI